MKSRLVLLLAITYSSAIAMQQPKNLKIIKETFYLERQEENGSTTLICEKDDTTYWLELMDNGKKMHAFKKSSQNQYPIVGISVKMMEIMINAEKELRTLKTAYAVLTKNLEDGSTTFAFVPSEK